MSTFKEQLYSVRRNPALMQQIALEELDRQLTGEATYDVPDATIPFVASMECGTLETAMAINEMEAQMRMLYPRLAITTEELYFSMSDRDYIGRFSTCAQTPFYLYLGYEEVVAKAVAYGDQGGRKITIPRLTKFTGAGIPFTMQYPIEIRVLRHGGLQIEYDGSVESPIRSLPTNIVEWDMILLEGMKVLRLKIPVDQFEITTHTESLNDMTLFEASYTFRDQFFFARVYLKAPRTTVWKEITTTHSAQVYNPMDVTAVLKVIGNKLQVSIPTIYTTQGMAVGDIRVDVYTTLGPVDRAMGDYAPNQFEANFNDLDDDSKYVSPLNTFGLKQALCLERVTGGASAVSFTDLRNQVIDNTMGEHQVPITGVQLESNLYRRGYALVSNIDNITDRQFLASRRLEAPSTLDIVSGAGCAMSTLRINMEQIAASVHVADNGDRLTIKPSMLYTFKNGVVNMVSDAAINALLNSSAEVLARNANESRYVYTPFHYVMDASDNNFDFRPYYLDNPTITQKTFVGENDTAALQAAVSSYSVTKTPQGYRIQVLLTSDQTFKDLENDQIVLQIGYRPEGETRYASVNGTFVGMQDKERVYQFDIQTNHDIDVNGNLWTTNMSMYSLSQTGFSTPLKTTFDVTIMVVNSLTPGYASNEFDDMVQTHLLPNIFMVVNRDRLETTLGYDMTRIWRRNRSVLSEESYQKWQADVPAYWAENQYVTDANGNTIITLGPQGQIQYQIHPGKAKGQPILDAQGNPTMAHFKGEVVLQNGQPVVLEGRKLLREVTMLMVDGLFYFVTEATAKKYATEIPMDFVEWLENDIDEISSKLLEECELYLYPTQTFGDTIVDVKDGITTTLNIEQSFAINFYLKASAYSNSTLRPALNKSSKANLNNMLDRKTVSRSDIVSKLQETSGEDVLALDFSGLGGDNDYPIITLEDDSVRLAIRKKLVVLANNELTIEDDVTFNYMKHTTNS